MNRPGAPLRTSCGCASAAASVTWQLMAPAATRHVARLLRVERELGSIEPGKLADLVALPLPPAGEAPDFAARVRVVQEGRRVPTAGSPGPPLTPLRVSPNQDAATFP